MSKPIKGFIEELEKKFKGKKLQEVEKHACEAKDKSRSERKEFIKALFWIRYTSLFREDKVFEKSDFKEYLFIRHQLRPETFEKEAWAFIKFPKEAEKFGTGLIAKARRVCGSKRVPDVLTKINALPEKKQVMGKINSIILEFERPEIKKSKADKKTRPTIKMLQSELDKAHNIITTQELELREAYNRIEKLKKTAEDYKKKYENLFKIISPAVSFIEKEGIEAYAA